MQPGIENLSTHVLRLMDKGVTGCQNVRALRDAESAGVTTTWNYLYGFPGERAEDYATIIAQMPRLHHLVPPTGAARIAIERFSPYFARPELGFAELTPAPQYAETYRLPEAELYDLAYLFAAQPQGVDESVVQKLTAALDRWSKAYPNSRLVYHDLGDRIVLVNERAAFDWTLVELTEPLEVALFRLLDQPRAIDTLVERAGTVGGDRGAVMAVLARFGDLGIVFTDADRWIQVATEAHNQMWLRIPHHRERSLV